VLLINNELILFMFLAFKSGLSHSIYKFLSTLYVAKMVNLEIFPETVPGFD
jgi:hypothetical protein